MTFCECGCGKPVKPENRYVNGHNSKGKKQLIEDVVKRTKTFLKTLEAKKNGTWIEPISVLCGCGCKQLTKPGNKFINNHHTRLKIKPILDPKPCECGCGLLAKSGNKYLLGHNNRGRILPTRGKSEIEKFGVEKAFLVREKIKQSWKIKMEKGYIHPNRGKSSYKRNKHWEEIFGEERAKEMREEASNSQKQLCLEHPEKIQKFIDAGGFKSLHKKRILNGGFVWNGVHFLSSEELTCAKLLLTKPIKGVNCHVSVNGKIVDFFPSKDDKLYHECFVEYHPCITCYDERTKDQYYQDRKQVIDNSQYSGTNLVLITSLDELKGGK